jgi:hypothetical protein
MTSWCVDGHWHPEHRSAGKNGIVEHASDKTGFEVTGMRQKGRKEKRG